MKPTIGQIVPPFSLTATDYRGSQLQISPATLQGKPFVLFVYPRDNTPGCSVEACNFRDLWQEFREIGVEILGLSRDSLRSHANFIKKNELPYLLIADERRELIGAWGLIIKRTNVWQRCNENRAHDLLRGCPGHGARDLGGSCAAGSRRPSSGLCEGMASNTG